MLDVVMSTALDVVLICLFAATILMAGATVVSRFVHQMRGTGYP